MNSVVIPIAVPQWMIETTIALLEVLPFQQEVDINTGEPFPVTVFTLWKFGFDYGLVTKEEIMHRDTYSKLGTEFMKMELYEFLNYIR